MNSLLYVGPIIP